MSIKSNLEWCRQCFNSMTLGGVWAVPRSGLMFTRTGENSMALTSRLPMTFETAIAGGAPEGVSGWVKTVEEWQQADFETIQDYFQAAGIEVEDQTKGK